MHEPLLHRDRCSHDQDNTQGQDIAHRWDTDRIAEDEGT